MAFEDITERKRAEEARALQQEEYIQMQAGMLAELSTPLIPITGEVAKPPSYSPTRAPVTYSRGGGFGGLRPPRNLVLRSCFGGEAAKTTTEHMT